MPKEESGPRCHNCGAKGKIFPDYYTVSSGETNPNTGEEIPMLCAKVKCEAYGKVWESIADFMQNRKGKMGQWRKKKTT